MLNILNPRYYKSIDETPSKLRGKEWYSTQDRVLVVMERRQAGRLGKVTAICFEGVWGHGPESSEPNGPGEGIVYRTGIKGSKIGIINLNRGSDGNSEYHLEDHREDRDDPPEANLYEHLAVQSLSYLALDPTDLQASYLSSWEQALDEN